MRPSIDLSNRSDGKWHFHVCSVSGNIVQLSSAVFSAMGRRPLSRSHDHQKEDTGCTSCVGCIVSKNAETMVNCLQCLHWGCRLCISVTKAACRMPWYPSVAAPDRWTGCARLTLSLIFAQKWMQQSVLFSQIFARVQENQRKKDSRAHFYEGVKSRYC